MKVMGSIVISKEKFKSIFESVFLLTVFSFCGLAYDQYIAQPLLKLVFASIILTAWISMLVYGFLYKESYIFKCSQKDKLLIYVLEQLAYCSLLVINCVVISGALYT